MGDPQPGAERSARLETNPVSEANDAMASLWQVLPGKDGNSKANQNHDNPVVKPTLARCYPPIPGEIDFWRRMSE
jgi:hypothetical protein